MLHYLTDSLYSPRLLCGNYTVTSRRSAFSVILPPFSPLPSLPFLSNPSIPHPCFCSIEASEEIARHYRNSVISDGVVYSKMTNADILKLVRAHLFAHVVRMPFGEKDSSYYTQVIRLIFMFDVLLFADVKIDLMMHYFSLILDVDIL